MKMCISLNFIFTRRGLIAVITSCLGVSLPVILGLLLNRKAKLMDGKLSRPVMSQSLCKIVPKTFVKAGIVLTQNY